MKDKPETMEKIDDKELRLQLAEEALEEIVGVVNDFVGNPEPTAVAICAGRILQIVLHHRQSVYVPIHGGGGE